MAVTNFGVYGHKFDEADIAGALAAARTLATNVGEPAMLFAGEHRVSLQPKLVEALTEILAVIASKGNAAVFVVDEGQAFSLADVGKLLGRTRKQMYAAPDRELLPLTAARQVKISELLGLMDEAAPDPEQP